MSACEHGAFAVDSATRCVVCVACRLRATDIVARVTRERDEAVKTANNEFHIANVQRQEAGRLRGELWAAKAEVGRVTKERDMWRESQAGALADLTELNSDLERAQAENARLREALKKTRDLASEGVSSGWCQPGRSLRGLCDAYAGRVRQIARIAEDALTGPASSTAPAPTLTPEAVEQIREALEEARPRAWEPGSYQRAEKIRAALALLPRGDK